MPGSYGSLGYFLKYVLADYTGKYGSNDHEQGMQAELEDTESGGRQHGNCHVHHDAAGCFLAPHMRG